MMSLRLGSFTVLVVLAIVSLIDASKTVDNYLTANDVTRLQKLFAAELKSNDLQSIYYSSLNVPTLSTGEKNRICDQLKSVYDESKLSESEKNYYYVTIGKTMACSAKPAAAIVDSIKSSLAKDGTSVQELFFNFFAASSVGGIINADTKTQVAKQLQSVLRKDDSLLSLGLAFHVAAELGTAGKFAVDRIEDALVQADEIDGKMLQFEGGLSVTALVLNGALKLAKANSKPAPISADQAQKFANYLLSRRSVQSTKGASLLLEALRLVAEQKNVAPICIRVIGNGQLNPDSPVLNLNVVNLDGSAIIPPPASIKASIAAKGASSPIAADVIVSSRSSDKTVFSIDLASLKLARGAYTADVIAGDFSQKLSINVLGRVKVSALELGIGESDSSIPTKRQSVVFPTKLAAKLSADVTQKVTMKAVLVDERSEKPITVQQAFVRISNVQTNDEIIYVAEQDSAKSYKFDMDVEGRGSDFAYKSGLYAIHFIVGDNSLFNSFTWHLADIQLDFSHDAKRGDSSQLGQTKANNRRLLQKAQSEIVHQFREPEKRPPRFFSDVFAGLCLAPLGILLILWIKLGVNLSNFSFNLSTIGFHIGFAAILSLFFIFWLQMNMFETIRYLIPLALFTFVCGNRMLRAIASKKYA